MIGSNNVVEKLYLFYSRLLEIQSIRNYSFLIIHYSSAALCLCGLINYLLALFLLIKTTPVKSIPAERSDCSDKNSPLSIQPKNNAITGCT